MTIRILNPRDWAQLETGFAIPMHGEAARIMKIEFNTSAPTAIHMSFDGEPDAEGALSERVVFLGVVDGLDKIEVVADPGSQIVATGDGEVWYCTNEGQFNGILLTEDQQRSFTQLIGERTRADVLEEMVMLASRNFEQLRAQQEQERADAQALAQRLAAAEATIAAGNAPSVVTGAEPGEGQTQPAPAESPAVST